MNKPPTPDERERRDRLLMESFRKDSHAFSVEILNPKQNPAPPPPDKK